MQKVYFYIPMQAKMFYIEDLTRLIILYEIY